MEKYRQLIIENPIIHEGEENIYRYYDFLFPFYVKYKHTTYKVRDQMVGIIGGKDGLLFSVESVDVIEYPMDTLFGLFPNAVAELVGPVEEGFRMIGIYLLAGIIAVAGLMMLLKSSSRSVQYAKEIAFGIIVALVLLMFAVNILKLFGELNRLGVNLAYAMLEPDERGTSFINMLYNKNTRSLGMAIVSIITIFMIAALNFQYMVRLISLTILCCMSPVAAVIAVFPSRKEALSLWLNELISNVFMQTCHAFLCPNLLFKACQCICTGP